MGGTQLTLLEESKDGRHTTLLEESKDGRHTTSTTVEILGSEAYD